MRAYTEDTELIAEAYAYVIEMYRELSDENGAPMPGTQNQAVDVILSDLELCRAVREWAAGANIGEASTAPPRRLPRDALYERVRAFLAGVMEPSVFTPASA